MEKKSGVGSQASSFSESLREGSSLQLDPPRSAGIRADQARPGHVGSSLYTHTWGNDITVGGVEKGMAGNLSSAIRSSNPWRSSQRIIGLV